MDEPRLSAQPKDLRSFGRKRGRKGSPRQQRLLADLLPRVSVDAANLSGLAGRETWLEIGFGGGEHLIWQAEHNPDVLVIGCEPFEDGIVKVLGAIEAKPLSNVRVHPDDARPLLRALPEASISRAFILFPDPWPKKRHAKRRLVSPQLLELMARALKPGSELRVATDIGDYARTALLAVAQQGAFSWTANCPADWRVRGADWPGTRYEAKANAAGRMCYFLKFIRV